MTRFPARQLITMRHGRMLRNKSERKLLRMSARLVAIAILGLAIIGFAPHAFAAKIERITSPGGIEAWLVSDKTLPLIAMTFAFSGAGAAQDAAQKPGVAYLAAHMMDEGAGDLDTKAFREALDSRAIEMQFNAARDDVRGSLRTLSENRNEAFRLLRLTLTAPRFDAEPLARVRGEILSGLRRETTSPSSLSNRSFWRAAYGDHSYGRPTEGTLESVPQIEAADLKAFTARTFARDNLKVAIVGDITASDAGHLLDEAFGALPAKAQLDPVPPVTMQNIGKQIETALDVPQAVITFGGAGIARNDPDFMAAYIVNHIAAGGTFSSRLYREVREKRGLAYSVGTSLIWLDHAALFAGSTATRADRAHETLKVITSELQRLAQDGPTQQELDEAKSYLKGSQMLALDSSTKLAAQLVQYQLDRLGIDYIDKRAAIIDAVPLDDAKRLAKRILSGGLLVSTVGPTPEKVSEKATPKNNP